MEMMKNRDARHPREANSYSLCGMPVHVLGNDFFS